MLDSHPARVAQHFHGAAMTEVGTIGGSAKAGRFLKLETYL
jgi:hypothetical protein